MPNSEANRKRAETSWPENAGRAMTPAERQRAKRARDRGEPEPLPPGTEPEILADAEPEPADLDRPVKDAVAQAITEWKKTHDPLANVAVGLAKTFDRCVSAGSGVPAATVADRLSNVLDRLRPTMAAAPAPGQPLAKATDPADLVAARARRLAEQAKLGPAR